MKNFILLLICLFIIFSCSNSQSKKDPFSGTQTFQLMESELEIKLPLNFKRSSKYRLKEDMPELAKDSASFNSVIRILDRSEFIDSKPDFFVDTTSSFHFIHILDDQFIPINKTTGAIFKTQLNNIYRDLESKNSDIGVVEVESNLQSNKISKLLRYKHHIKNWAVESDGFYSNTFILSTKSVTLNITEINEKGNDSSKYLWSIR